MVLDAILATLLLTISIIGVYRGCGKIIFDFLALLGTLWLDSSFYTQAAHSLRIVTNDDQNNAYVFAILFVTVGAIGLVISHIAYDCILLSLGILDKTLGFVVGVATAIVLCHVIVKTINISTFNSTQPSIIASSHMGDEMLNFTTYHNTLNSMYDATGGRRTVEVYH